MKEGKYSEENCKRGVGKDKTVGAEGKDAKPNETKEECYGIAVTEESNQLKYEKEEKEKQTE